MDIQSKLLKAKGHKSAQRSYFKASNNAVNNRQDVKWRTIDPLQGERSFVSWVHTGH